VIPTTTKPATVKPSQEKRTSMPLNGNISKGILVLIALLLGAGIAINGYLATTLLGHISSASLHENGEQKANRIRVVFSEEIGKSAKLLALTIKNSEQDTKIEKLSDQLEKILQSLARVEAKLDSK
jgi:uncharacterized protein HemX